MVRVAIVTGSNTGIGFAAVRGLCTQLDPEEWHVYLLSRDDTKGKQAVKELEKEGLKPKYHQLDVCNKESINTLKEFLQKEYDGLDILVNNAGMAFKAADPTPFKQQAEITPKTNYYGLMDVCEAMFPILKPGARVVHTSSFTSFMVIKKLSEARKNQFINAKSVQEVTELLKEFVSDVQEDKVEERGWSESAYATSKLAVTAATPLQQAEMDTKRPGDDIIINSACPGFVMTNMTAAYKGGGVTPDVGADTLVYLSLLPSGEKKIRGQFVQRRKVYDWKNGEYCGIPK